MASESSDGFGVDPTALRYEKIARSRVEFIEEVWNLKEEIRENDGVLRQPQAFFKSAYAQNTAHLYLDGTDVIGFSVVKDNGYVVLLGVKPGYRGMGIGKDLIEKVEDDRQKISCHTRVSNTNALEFYDSLGFEVMKYVDSYYSNGDSAYYLVKDIEPRD